MSSETDVDDRIVGDATDVDPPTDRVCYRCDRPLVDDRWIRLSTRPRSGLPDYNGVSRPCCPDCVAALGLLAIDPDRASTASESG